MPIDSADIASRLAELRIEHRDLDLAIGRMQAASEVDDLALRRLKKRKLMLKDWIAKLESMLIPDTPA
ncbi:MAG: YdcH family protein [Proteobacteria bacterium]|nr:YdcH family protein [Pseudomonadota bacterium]